jgi:hypothetical protein
MKLIVPTSWADVTVRQFMDLAKVPDLKFDEMDASFRTLAILCNVSDEVFIDMPLPELKQIIAKVDFIKHHKTSFPIKNSINIKGKRYSINYNAKKLLAGEYIDMQNYIKGGVNNSLNHCIAVYLKPVNIFGFRKRNCYKEGGRVQTLESRNATAEWVLDNLAMDIVLPMSGFFLKNWEKLIKHTQIFLEIQQVRASKNLKRELHKAGLSTLTAGI